LGLLDPKRPLSRQPVLPATLAAEAETLLLRRPGATPNTLYVLRIWRAPVLLEDGQPLWMGTTQTLRFKRPIRGFGLWMPEPGDAAARERLRADLEGLPMAESNRPQNGPRVLRIRSDMVEPRVD